MGRGDNRLTPKVRRKRAQKKLKNRVRKKIAAGKSQKKSGPLGARPMTQKAPSTDQTTIRRGNNE